jgi:hypothetical protein
MTKKGKDPLEEYLKLKDEMLRDKVNEVFRTQPKNWRVALEELGLQYYDDDDEEELEERQARPESADQKALVAYFEGHLELSEELLTLLLEERRREGANLPLIRKYFRAANQRLKTLILHGLERYPTSIALLSDLAYFHEFENNLRLVITHYTRACVQEKNLQVFSELARDFYEATIWDDYDAFYALKDLFELETKKRKIVDFLVTDAERERSEEIPF